MTPDLHITIAMAVAAGGAWPVLRAGLAEDRARDRAGDRRGRTRLTVRTPDAAVETSGGSNEVSVAPTSGRAPFELTAHPKILQPLRRIRGIRAEDVVEIDRREVTAPSQSI